MAAAVGQHLVFQVMVEVVEKLHHGTSPDWWCNDEALVSRLRAVWVDNLECWIYPQDRPIRVLGWEAVPPPRTIEPTVLWLMPGEGYRMQLEVVRPGPFAWVDKGTCNVETRTALQVVPP